MNIIKDQGYPDFVMLKDINEQTFLDNLKTRFEKKQIYTYIGGDQVVAVNPFSQSERHLYSEDTRKSYRNKYNYEVQPHIFALGDDTYRDLLRSKKDQCVIITGESGAGKTEASKTFLSYITAISSCNKDKEKTELIKELLIESNPVLEAFGNSKTLRNDNSSRFGKYMEVLFDGAGAPQGGNISQYLLEKSRVVTRAKGERSFHIFYYLLSQSELCNKYGLFDTNPVLFEYLKLSDCYAIDRVNDNAEFTIVDQAMSKLGFSDQDKEEIWKVLIAILLIGNIQFEEAARPKEQPARIVNAGLVKQVAQLLGLTPDDFRNALCSQNFRSGRGSTVAVFMDAKQAKFTANSIAKELYARLFTFVVNHINECINIKSDKRSNVADLNTIGILDIYGFEIFEDNSFEQFCINYCNEKLQQLFIELVLKQEQEEYRREGIDWKEIDYFNNDPIIKLLEGKGGIIDLLNETCAYADAKPEDLLNKLDKILSTHSHYKSANVGTKSRESRELFGKFRISHYAGDVDYNVDHFIFKNRDTLYASIARTMATSTISAIRSMFPVQAEESHRRPVTAATQFRRNVQDLCLKLRHCQPHYIRCIKSNDAQRGFHLDVERTAHQVRYLNLVETVRVRKAGFVNRQPFDRFLARYKMIGNDTWPQWHGSDQEGAMKVLEALGLTHHKEYELGKTKLFVKSAETLTLIENRRLEELHKVAVTMQRCVRAYLNRKILQAIIEEIQEIRRELNMPKAHYTRYQLAGPRAVEDRTKERDELQAILKFKRLVESIFGGNKENFDSNRKYLGDYMQQSNYSEEYKKVITGLFEKNGDDKLVLFSDKVWKVNRRGKSQKRVLIVTDKNIYKFAADEKTHELHQRKVNIPLTGVKCVSVSPFGDTFMVIHCEKPNRDLVIDLGDGVNHEEKVSELTALLYDHIYSVTGNRIVVNFVERIPYNNSRTDKNQGVDRVLSFRKVTHTTEDNRMCYFAKQKGKEAEVYYVTSE